MIAMGWETITIHRGGPQLGKGDKVFPFGIPVAEDAFTPLFKGCQKFLGRR